MRLVGRPDIGATHAAAGGQLPALLLHSVAQGLDFIAINSPPSQHHFEAVVIFRVVAAGDLDARCTQGMGSKIQHGCRHHAHINHFYACFYQPGN